MRLIQAEITAFGKFKNFSLSFEEGLNRLIRPNEFGKTTLIHFLYFMLFGYEAKRLKGYFPWDEAALAGALVLEHQGKRWRIERIHPAKGAEKRKIFCPNTGEELVLSAKEQPAGRFLSIDGETFLRTLCITESDLLFARTDGLDVALKNLTATGDENVSYSQAEGYLRDLHKRYMHWGKTQGPLLDLKKELENDRLRLSALQQQVSSQLVTKGAWERLEQERAEQMTAIAALQERLKKATASDALARLQQLQLLREQKTNLEPPAVSEADLDRLEAAFNQQEEAIRLAKDCAEEKTRAWEQLQLLTQSADRFGFHSGTALQREELNKKTSPLLMGGVGSAVLSAVALVLGVLLHPYAYLAAGILLAAAVGCFLGHSFRRNSLLRANGVATLGQLNEKWAQYQEVLSQLQAQQQQFDLFSAQEAEVRRKEEDARRLADSLKAQFRILTAGELKEARILWGVYRQSENRADLRLQEQMILGNKTEEEWQALAKNAVPCEETAEQVQALLSEAEEQLRNIQHQKDALELGDLRTLWEEQTRLGEQVQQKEQQVQQWQQELLAVQQSLAWLKAANEEMNTRFAPRLCAEAGALLSRLTEGKYESLTMDEKFNIFLTVDSATHPLSAFSSGTQDAVYFAFRTAVSDLISEAPLPLILDDPFVHLDETRKKAAETLLEKATEERQILYFSCRE